MKILEITLGRFYKKYPTFSKILIAFVFVFFIARVGLDVLNLFPNIKLSDKELKEKTLELSREIMDYVMERQENEPKLDFNDWISSLNAVINYSHETRNLFIQKYSSNTSFYYGEFHKRGMIGYDLWFLNFLFNSNDEYFIYLCEDPVNINGMRRIAVKLGALAYEL